MKLQELHEAKGKSFKDVFGDMSSEKIDWDIDCYNHGLTSLEGAPRSVSGDFFCFDNHLTSLEGAPRSISGGFYCSGNKLTSLEGAPQNVNGDFYCCENKLTSLKDVHKQIKAINGVFNAKKNPITSHVIGLILISGCTQVLFDSKEVAKILNKYLGKGRAGLIDCAEELVKAGYPEMAKL